METGPNAFSHCGPVLIRIVRSHPRLFMAAVLGLLVIALDPVRARASARLLQGWDVGEGFALPGGERPFAGKGVRVPTLEELLEEIRDVPINVDAKQRRPSMVRRLVETVRRLGAEDRVLVASFESSTLREVRAAGYAGPTAMRRFS